MPSVEYLHHHFVAKVQCVTGDSGLAGIDEQTHKGRRLRWFAVGFAEFGNLIELSLRRLLVGLLK